MNKNFKTAETVKRELLFKDAVGEEASVRPKQKHTNNLTSKITTSNAAITLVALVITIIVLLILAGVTLSMVMGESGIFGKANSAKEQTQLKTAEDTIKLAVLDNRTLRETGDASALSNKNLKVSIAEKLRDLGYNVAEDNNIVTYYEDKTIKIEDYLGKENNQGSITAKIIAENPETYYGKNVEFTSENGQDNWKIFYSDWNEKRKEQNVDNPTDAHIFLIAGDYINSEEKDRIDTKATGMDMSGYKVYWNTVPELQNVDATVLKIFKATEYKLIDKENSRCVSTLLNVNNWKKYLDKENGTGNAEYAMGSPTIEMWFDSWNNLYENVDGKLYRDASKSDGYSIGTTTDLRYSYYLYRDEMSKKKGYQNTLYYPHTENYAVYDDTYGYWIASPSAVAGSIFYVCNDGGLSTYSGQHKDYSIRPVVCLKSGIGINIKE